MQRGTLALAAIMRASRTLHGASASGGPPKSRQAHRTSRKRDRQCGVKVAWFSKLGRSFSNLRQIRDHSSSKTTFGPAICYAA